MRGDYSLPGTGLVETDANPDPMQQFDSWCALSLAYHMLAFTSQQLLHHVHALMHPAIEKHCNSMTLLRTSRQHKQTIMRLCKARTLSIPSNRQLACIQCIEYLSAPMHGVTRQTSIACRFNEAVQSEQISEANAMCIATATPEGRPSNRMVLMKGYDQRGFKFYSNYSSRKGQELERNSYASLCFWWEPLHRSVGLPSVSLLVMLCFVLLLAELLFGSILRAAVADLLCGQLHHDCYLQAQPS